MSATRYAFQSQRFAVAGQDPAWTNDVRIQELWNYLMAKEKITEEELVTRIRAKLLTLLDMVILSQNSVKGYGVLLWSAFW